MLLAGTLSPGLDFGAATGPGDGDGDGAGDGDGDGLEGDSVFDGQNYYENKPNIRI